MFGVKVDMIKGNILKSLILFALPLFISSIFQQLYNASDTMIVGNILGDRSLAAMGASSAVYDLLVGFALGIGNGLSIVTARSYGSKDNELIKSSVATSFVIGAVVTIVMMIISQLFLFPLLQLLKTPVDIIRESYSYISTITLFVGVMFAYNLLSGILRATGNSVMPLLFLILSSIINIGLDILFITRFNMGVQGAAVATVIAQGISVLLCIFYIYKKCPILLPERKHFRYNAELYRELLGQGLSMGFMMSIVSTGTVILQTSINGFGYLIIAGHTAARKLQAISLMPISTMALALATFVSQNKGADQGYRIRQGVRYANLISLSWGIIITLIQLLFSTFLVKTLSGSSEAIVITNGTRYLMFNAPFYAILGVLLNLRYALQGLGRKLTPLISSTIEFFGKILFVVLLIPTLGYWGVIISEPIIWCFMCLQLVYSFYKHPYIQAHKFK